MRYLRIIICLIVFASSNAMGGVFDNFNSVESFPLLNADKWNTLHGGEPSKLYMGPVKGKLKMQLRAGAGTSNTTGSARASFQMLEIHPSKSIRNGAAAFTRIESRLSVDSISMRGCERPDADKTLAEFVQSTEWFNDGRSTGQGDVTGNVYATIRIEQTEDATNKKRLDVNASVHACENEFCSAIDYLLEKTKIGTVRVNTDVSIRTDWQQSTNKFVFRLSAPGQTPKKIAASYEGWATPASLPGSGTVRHVFIQRVDVADCEVGGGVKAPFAQMKLSIDKILTRNNTQ